MKIRAVFILILIMYIVILSGCSAIESILYSEKANGVIIYGTEQQMNETEKQFKESIIAANRYPLKMISLKDQVYMVMNKQTAGALTMKGLLRKVISTSRTEPIESLPALTKDKGILFGREKMEQINVGRTEVKVSYEGNIIIGNTRRYANRFVIVDDSVWTVLKGNAKTMDILRFKKDPKNRIGEFKNVEESQLVTIK